MSKSLFFALLFTGFFMWVFVSSNSPVEAGTAKGGKQVPIVNVPIGDLDTAIQISAGFTHACAVTSSGGAKCWGSNTSRQLGDGTNTDRLAPVDVIGLTGDITAVTAGRFHTCALTGSGGVKCWGWNGNGLLGVGTPGDYLTPVDVVELTNGVAAVTAAEDHTCALTGSGGVKCWGWNGNGQLGDGTYDTRFAPVDVVGLTNGVTAVIAGDNHTCAVTSIGGVKCWGLNNYGQLGDGTNTRRNTPVDVSGLTSGVTAVTASQFDTCALTNSGAVKCWGSGSTVPASSTPVDVSGLDSGVTAVTAGYDHACAVTSSGGVKCWGGNDLGQLGDGTNTHRPTPVDVVGLTNGVTAVTAGYAYTCALMSNGGVKCWGLNHYGQLGIDIDWYRATPVATSGLTSGVTDVSAGYYHTCAVTSSGAVKCWGYNNSGQLGNGTGTEHHAPVDVVGLTNGITAVTAGYYHTCAVTSGGAVKCWGGNGNGQLGDGTNTFRLTPVGVSGLGSGVMAVTAGEEHTCALTGSGGVKCWGRNDYGQLGDGTTSDRLTPVDVVGLTDGVTALTAGGNHTCAVTSGGAVKCWGRNDYGQLGDGTTSDHPTPVDVVGLTNGVTAVTAGYAHTCALMSNGGVKCWGPGTPEDASGLGSGAMALTAGFFHTCALTGSGAVKCWGYNNSGQLGDGTRIDRDTPVDVVGLTNGMTLVTAGYYHTCAVTSGGAVKCWGANSSGQLGNGEGIYYTTPQDVVAFGGELTLSISGKIQDDSGINLAGVLVTPSFGQAATTDANGDYTLSGFPTGTFTITPTKSGYTFTPKSLTVSVSSDVVGQDFTGVIDSNDLAQAVKQAVSNLHRNILRVKNTAQEISVNGDYFSNQLPNDQLNLLVDGIVGVASTASVAFPAVKDAKEAALLSAPGVNAVGWKHIIDLRNASEPAKNAFRDAMLKPITTENAQLATKEFLNGAWLYYGAELSNERAENLVTDTLIKGALKIGLQNSLPFQSQFYPSFVEMSNTFDQDLDETEISTLANLPTLTPAEQVQYLADLQGRWHANAELASALNSRALPLQVVRETRESNLDAWWLPSFTERFVLTSLVGISPCDGVCVVGLKGLFTLGDLHKNWNRMQEDVKYMELAAQGTGGAFETQKRIYMNTVNGLELIKSKIPPQIPSGQVEGVVHKSVGEYKLFGKYWWWERDAYSEFSYSNTSNFDSRVQIFDDYGKSGFLGAGYQPLIAEGVATIPANQSGVVRVSYLQAEQGASPNESSNINASILASTDTGTYFITDKTAQWNPVRVTQNGTSARVPKKTAIEAAGIPVLPYPIRSSVNVQSDTLNYVPQLEINNPFTKTIHVVVTQPIPDGIQVLDPNGGTPDGSNLEWTKDIEPQNTVVITHSVGYAGQAGTTLTYPAATLEMSDGINIASFTSESSSVQTQAPLIGDAEPPTSLVANETVNLTFSISNRSASAQDGQVKLTLTDLNGQQVFQTLQNVNVSGSGTSSVILPLTSPVSGSYVHRAIVTSNEVPVEIYTTYLDVTCAKPAKPTLTKPKNGGTVKKQKVLLNWSDVSCANTYTIIIREDSKKGPKIQAAKNLTISQLKTKNLTSGKTYFWRVTASNDKGSTKSKWWSFTVQ